METHSKGCFTQTRIGGPCNCGFRLAQLTRAMTPEEAAAFVPISDEEIIDALRKSILPVPCFGLVIEEVHND